MARYEIWYAVDPSFWKDRNLNHDNLKKSHKFVQVIEAGGLEDCYNKMQHDVWSPNDEADDLIRCLGLNHISMTVGDVVIEAANREMWQRSVEMKWKRIHKSSQLQHARKEASVKETAVALYVPAKERPQDDRALINI